MTRAELEGTYTAPYRRWLPRLYVVNRLPWLLALAVALWVIAAVTDSLYAVAAVETVLVAAWATWVTMAGTRAISARTADWRKPDLSELGRLRASRPHAGEADPANAHDEFAVAVSEDGELVTWRFRPLTAFEHPQDGELLLTGTPRYAASVVTTTPHDAHDAVRAAEQLAAAQAAAAARERDAGERAGTGAALRQVTGQGPR